MMLRPRPLLEPRRPAILVLVIVAALAIVTIGARVGVAQPTPPPGGSGSGTTAPDQPDTDPAAGKASTALLNSVQSMQVLQQSLSGLDGQIADANAAVASEDAVVMRQHEASVAADDATAAAQHRARDLALALYMNGGSNGLQHIASLLSDTSTDRSGRVDALQHATLRDATDAFSAARTTSGQAHGAETTAVQHRDATVRRRDQLVTQRAQAQQALQAAQAKADALRNQVNVAALVQANGGSIGGILAARQAGQVPPPIVRIFAWPLATMHMSSPFGYRTDPISGASSFHPGADFPQPTGTPIMAAGPGTVVIAGPEDGYGNATVIDHGNALATLYGHQSAIIVKPGDVVTTGQVIGYVGTTGYSTGPHLHFEVRVLGKPVDPVPWINPPVS